MFSVIGYDFLGGPNALNSAPGVVDDITSTELNNAIYDHFNVSKDTDLFGDYTIPKEWNYDTILNATFDGTTGAGNLEYTVSQINSIKIKRRIKPKTGEAVAYNADAYRWLTLEEIKIDSVDDLIFTFTDFLNAYGVEYEYALVPVVNGVEGRYIVDSVLSKFNGIFIGDAYQTFKFLYDVSYSSNTRNQQVGVFTPLGKKYPVIVDNGLLSYDSGSVSASILNDDYEDTGIIDRPAIVEKKNTIKDFLTNKKPKILKDWNGQEWLVVINGSPSVEYKQGSGMGIPTVNFSWTEIGDHNNQRDLYDAGILDTLD